MRTKSHSFGYLPYLARKAGHLFYVPEAFLQAVRFKKYMRKPQLVQAIIQIPSMCGVMDSFSQEGMCQAYKSLQCSCPVAASGLCENKRAPRHTHTWHVQIVHLYCLYLYLHAFMLHPCENICLHARENTRVHTHTHTFDVFKCNLRYIICTQSNMSTTHCPERSANRSAVLQTINQFARVCERFGKAHGVRTVRWVLKTHKAH